jgi:adenylate kinase
MQDIDAEVLGVIKNWLNTGSINIFGRPFAGKDSQGHKLANIFNCNMIGGGDILRNSVIPDDIKAHMHAGKLIPSEDYVKIVLPYLSQPSLSDKPLILSSVGRWKGEEYGVVEALNKSGHPLKAVIYLDVPEEASYERWLARTANNDRNGRHDDSEEVLHIRFNEFRDKTLPVIDYYHNIGMLITINALGSRDQVTSDIIEALRKLAS